MTELTATQVADFLRQQPEFFVDQAPLLLTLKVPHETGGARSLIEYQVTCLRQRNQELLQQLEQVHQVALANERLFRLCTELTAELLGCTSLAQLRELFTSYCQQQFAMDAVSLLWFLPPQDPALQPYQVSRDSALDILGQQFADQGTLCGPLRPAALEFLFGVSGTDLGSVALVALGANARHGVLALGSQDAHQFHAQMGTLFLSYLGDIMSRLLPRWLHED